MEQDNYKYHYEMGREKLYFYDKNQISLEEFFVLEYTAALENKMMQHKIFFVLETMSGMKIFTSLN